MATYLVPLESILTDPDHPVDLTALPPDEAIERIKQLYGFWGPLIDVRIEHGVAVIELPDAAGEQGRHRARQDRQAAKAGRSGRYREAAALYEDALRILPQHTEARRELAMVQMELGQPAAAKQNLIRILQLDPRDAWAYLILGNLYYKHEHDGGSAERYFATAADLASDDSYVLNSYGGLLAERGRYAEANALFERAIAAKPDHPNPYLGLAMVARKQDDEDAALAALERLFAQSSGDAAADSRSQPVYAEARRSYAALRARRAERLAGAAAAELQAAHSQVCGSSRRNRSSPANSDTRSVRHQPSRFSSPPSPAHATTSCAVSTKSRSEGGIGARSLSICGVSRSKRFIVVSYGSSQRQPL